MLTNAEREPWRINPADTSRPSRRSSKRRGAAQPAEIYAQDTAVYRLFDSDLVLLYVGVSNDPEVRIRLEHASEKYWWRNVDESKTRIDWYPDRISALKEEKRSIKEEKPVFNQVGADKPPPSPLAKPLAAQLREAIRSGRLRPGQLMPSEKQLSLEHGCSRLTARRAVQILRNEGLVVWRNGLGTYVKEQRERSVLHVPASAVITAAIPTPEERAELDVGEGVPVFSVLSPDGSVAIYPADRWQLSWPRS